MYTGRSHYYFYNRTNISNYTDRYFVVSSDLPGTLYDKHVRKLVEFFNNHKLTDISIDEDDTVIIFDDEYSTYLIYPTNNNSNVFVFATATDYEGNEVTLQIPFMDVELFIDGEVINI